MVVHNARRRRRSRRKDDGASRALVRDRMRSNSFYFFCFLAMTFIQAVGMILVGLCSYSLHNGSLFGPMEIYMMSHLWIHHDSTRMEDTDEQRVVDDDVRQLEDLLTDQTAKRLKDQMEQSSSIGNRTSDISKFLQAMLNDTDALDDYYNRPHIKRRVGAAQTSNEDLPVLIVGGSDGSGTRVFVDLLKQLGVPMLVDDKGTLDVHAPVMFSQQDKKNTGWPPLVSLVLEETHSADYDLTKLSPRSLKTSLQELRRFQLSYAPGVKELLKDTAEQNKSTANHVQYGFKAPVSMLLLPLLLQTFKRVKFLHVVRDGRDVSFSRNTSPVSKFYNSFYRNATEKRNANKGVQSAPQQFIEAIQLWNDWNHQVWDWERRNADGDSFDFLVMRTEDLLSPETKFESLVKLADFVGSPLTIDDLCCLSRQALVDMGHSGLGMGGRRDGRRNKDPFHLPPPGADYSGFGEQSVGIEDTSNLDDPEDISLEDVALESERKALNLALEKRPEVFQRIQQARKNNFVRHKARKKQIADQQQERRYRKYQDVADGLGKVLNRLSGDRHRLRRRLSEIADEKWGNIEGVNSRIRRFVHGREVEDHAHARTHGRRKEPKERRQAPEMVLQRYGKWRSALEGRPELSRVLHKEGSEALRIFGYEPVMRFSDLPPKGLAVCETGSCSTATTT